MTTTKKSRPVDMIRTLLVAASGAALLLSAGCAGQADDAGDKGNNDVDTVVGAVSGVVTGLSDPLAPREMLPVGEALAFVEVSAFGHAPVYTDEMGRFEITGLEPGVEVEIRFEREGYAETLQMVRVPEAGDRAGMHIGMLPVRSFTLDTHTGGNFRADGITVSVAADAVVDRDGNPVSGEIELQMTPIIPGTNSMHGVPGNFMAHDRREAPKALQSVTMVHLEAYAGDEQVFLSRSTQLRIDAEEAGVWTPDSRDEWEQGIPFWGFDETAGRWTRANNTRLIWDDGRPTLLVQIPGIQFNDDGTWNYACADDQICLRDGSADPRGRTDQISQGIIGGAELPDDAVVEMDGGEMRAVGALVVANGGGFNTRCTATLISDRHVLTAAHCLADTDGEIAPAQDLAFLVGEDIRTGEFEMVFPIRRVAVSPRWCENGCCTAEDPALRCDRAAQDVAILELGASAAVIADFVGVPLTPIAPMDGGLAAAEPGDKLQLAGYGRTADNEGAIENTRRWWTTGVAGQESIGRFHINSQSPLCYGDMGGPALTEVDGQLRIVGVAARLAGEDETARCAGPVEYASVAEATEFITEQLGIITPDDPDLPPTDVPDPDPQDPPQDPGDGPTVDLPPEGTPPPIRIPPEGVPGQPPSWWNCDKVAVSTGMQGMVVDWVGNPLQSAHVTIWNRGAPETRMTNYTGGDGKWYIYPLPINQTVDLVATIAIDPALDLPDMPHVGFSYIMGQNTGGFRPPSPRSGYKMSNPDPLRLPVCRLAGRVNVSRFDDQRALGYGGTLSSNAVFYKPGGLERCQDAESEFIDNCTVMELGENNIDNNGMVRQRPPAPRRTIDVGKEVPMSSAGAGGLVLEMTETEDGPVYSAFAGKDNLDALSGGRLSFNAGEIAAEIGGGLDKMQLTGAMGQAGQPMDLRRSVNVSWQTRPNPGTSEVFISALPRAGKGNALACIVRDDGDFTLPASKLSALESGEYDLFVGRNAMEYQRMPDGRALFVNVRQSTVRDAQR